MILLYHKVYLCNYSTWWIDVDNFYRQMVELKNKKVVYLDEYDAKDPNHIVITFDGVYQNVLEYAAPILQKFNYPFELFVTGNYISKDSRFDPDRPIAKFTSLDDLKKLISYGGRLQWHSNSHPNFKNIFDLGIINSELSIPEHIRNLDPFGFNWFAYPYGEYSESLVKEVRKKFRGALSVVQGSLEDQFSYNRETIINDTSFKKNKIAVIIPSYNYGHYLIEAIESVLHQTVLPDEILIIDDCSTDDTQNISEEYVRKYPKKIKFVRNEINLGIVKTFNKAVSLTSSEYIAFLGADNRFLSNYIENCLIYVDQDPQIAIAYTDLALFGQRAKLVYSNFPLHYRGKVKDGFYIIHFPQFQIDLMNDDKYPNFIHGSSLFRREAFNNVGGYLLNQNEAEDANLFRRIINAGYKAIKVSNTMLEYRQHSHHQANIQLVSNTKIIFYRSKIDELEKQIEGMKKSFSWRLTKPLRLFYIIFSGKIFRSFIKYSMRSYEIFRQEGFLMLLKRTKRFINKYKL